MLEELKLAKQSY